MKFYVATGLAHAHRARELARKLEALGLRCAYPWWEHGSVQAEGPGRIAEVAQNEAAGVQEAELFIALLPGGRGTHTELGMAIVHAQYEFDEDYRKARRRIIVVGDLIDTNGCECSFYRHPRVTHRFGTVDVLELWLIGMFTQRMPWEQGALPWETP